MLSTSSSNEVRVSGKQLESVETVSSLLTAREHEQAEPPRKLNISRNRLETLPSNFISQLKGIVELDVSDNRLKVIAAGLSHLDALRVIDARGNSLAKLPEDLGGCTALEEVNFGENLLELFPQELLVLPALKRVYLGSNRISKLPREIEKMTGLEVLFLSGNRLTSIPFEIAQLPNLVSMTLCHNHLSSLPLAVSDMHQLVSLQLHNNRLETLPPGLLQLRQLREISLRCNPLVTRFVREHVDEVPSLMEFAARSVKKHNVAYSKEILPRMLVDYLDSSQHCDNPACRGVYFQVCYRQVKFADFCGKYRIPFLHYLCSPGCHDSVPGHSSAYSGQSSSQSDDTGDELEDVERRKMKRVLLSDP